MKNKLKLFGIITLVVIIGFLMVTCDNDNGGNDSTGKLTITGFSDEFNGKYVIAQLWSTDVDEIYAAETASIASDKATFGLISNNKVTLNVWEIINMKQGNFNKSGDFTFIRVTFATNASGANPEDLGSVTATFENGIGNGIFLNP